MRLYLFKCSLISLLSGAMILLCTACNNNPFPGKALTLYRADTTILESLNNHVFYHQKLFTSKLFALYGNADTAYVKEYKEGSLNGVSKSFYPHHRMAEIRRYADGKREGQHTGFWQNGTTKFIHHYHEDVFEGTQREWFANGMPYLVANYQNGHEQGAQQVWDSTGKLITNYHALNGRNYGIIGTKNCRSLWKKDSFAVVR